MCLQGAVSLFVFVLAVVLCCVCTCVCFGVCWDFLIIVLFIVRILVWFFGRGVLVLRVFFAVVEILFVCCLLLRFYAL